jgi:signal transduction histidine kinase
MQLDEETLTLLLSTCIIISLVTIVMVVLIRGSKLRIQQQMNLTEMQLSYEKELRKVEYEMQEATMSTIARELHDNIGQLLSLTKIRLEALLLKEPQLRSLLQPVDEALFNAQSELKLLSRQLASDSINQAGLIQTIQRDIAKWSPALPFTMEFSHDDTEPRLSNDERLMAYRMFQEMIQNIIKHAAATQVSVTLQGQEPFMLRVRDDGKGFDYSTVAASSGSGLRNLAKRSEAVQFYHQIITAPGKGTTILISKSQ